jgi:hypothetical protein
LRAKFGVCLPNFGKHLSVDAITTVAAEAEEMGFSSVLGHRPSNHSVNLQVSIWKHSGSFDDHDPERQLQQRRLT